MRWISSRGRRRSAEFRESDQLMGVSVDITENKRAEDTLQRSYAEMKVLKERVEAESEYLQEEIKLIGSFDEIVGHSRALRQILKKIEQLAQTDSVVLITGETGTGKELIVNAIHFNSRRAKGPLVKVNCAAIPETLLESELFGHEKGAFTNVALRRIGLKRSCAPNYPMGSAG